MNLPTQIFKTLQFRMLSITCVLLNNVAWAESSPATSNNMLPAALRAHIEYLADDLLEGRGTGTRGHALAAAYVAAHFKQLGLAPAGDNGSYLQTLRLLEATPVLPGSAAKLTRDAKSIALEYGADYLPFADYSAPNSTLTAPLMFAGFGITAPELNYDDFANLDVRDRIAVVFSGAPAKFPHDQRAFYSRLDEKYANLTRHGASGVIIIDTPTELAITPWERRIAMSWQPQMRWLTTDDQPVEAFTELKQRFRFSPLATARLFQDAPKNLEQLLAAIEAGEMPTFPIAGLITLTTTTGLRRTESANVVGLLKGGDPRLRNQYVVITAHLDHLGRGAAVNGDAIYNGAHDNASGIAVLLETARLLASSETPPKRSILFVATTAEEKGLLGSDYFANNPPVPLSSMVANINVDMPLLLAATRDLLAIGAEHSSLHAVVTRVVRNYGYILSPDDAPEQVRLVRSDQFSFVRQGIPAINLRSGYLSRRRDVDVKEIQRDYLHNRYHQPSDDLSLPVDYSLAADFVRINAGIALEIANDAERPRWNRGDFFAQKFGRR